MPVHPTPTGMVGRYGASLKAVLVLTTPVDSSLPSILRFHQLSMLSAPAMVHFFAH